MIQHNVLMIIVNQIYEFGMNRRQLYEITRGVWKLGPRREKAQYALSVYEGVVREVYEIQSWHPAGTTPYRYRSQRSLRIRGRWEFVGKTATAQVRELYLGKNVRSYLTAGGRNPIRYMKP